MRKYINTGDTLISIDHVAVIRLSNVTDESYCLIIEIPGLPNTPYIIKSTSNKNNQASKMINRVKEFISNNDPFLNVIEEGIRSLNDIKLMEKEYIEIKLKELDWNVSELAKQENMPIQTLKEKIRRHQLPYKKTSKDHITTNDINDKTKAHTS